ncbi:MAG: RHS repeat-associated core domain-containing protein [Desulfobacterales bacterium]|nr:RHS repeat-associated core domain-containing protein [Desulfobacterales bacterium]
MNAKAYCLSAYFEISRNAFQKNDNEGQLNTGYSSTYTFDYEHRLTAISGQQSAFSYDGAGNRLKAVRSGVETRYIYDAGGNLLAEADVNNVITKYYIYGAGLLAMVTPAGDVYNYHYNAIGSTVAMTNQSQSVVNSYAYDPFGTVLSQNETVPQPFKYIGQFGVMAEPNGFYYMRARYYDPNVGRFISEDPIGFEGGDTNLFAYVGNNPVTLIDPSGQLAFFWHEAITYVAARNSGRGVWDSLKLAFNNAAVDFSGTQGQNAAAVVQHAMATPVQSPQQAITATNAYIQASISSGNLAGATHAAQDLATPGHAGQPWSGFGLNWETAKHLLGDTFPSLSTINQAYQNTKGILNPKP